MTTVKEIIEDLQKYNPDAVVYVYADHGQTEERTSGVFQVTEEVDLNNMSGYEVEWLGIEEDDTPCLKTCTAVCLG